MKQSIKLILIYLAYQLIAGILMMFVGNSLELSEAERLGWALLLSGAIMIIHLTQGGHVSTSVFSLGTVSLARMTYSVFCVLGTMVCFDALNTLMPLPNWLESNFIALSQTLTGILSIALIAPIVEEMLFRGAIMSYMLQQGYPPIKVIILSAALFGFIHFNPVQVVFAFLMGVVFGWIRLKSESILPVIIGHILNNSIGVAEICWFGNDTTLSHGDSVTSTTLIIVALSGAVVALLSAIKLGRVEQQKNINN